jgi:hypothetical protein
MPTSSPSTGQRSTEALCVMLGEQGKIDEANNITITCKAALKAEL